MRSVVVDCPTCGAPTLAFGGMYIDAHSNTADDLEPMEGDIGVCIFCARPYVFLTFGARRPTYQELAELLDAIRRDGLYRDSRVAAVISAIKKHGPRAPGNIERGGHDGRV